MHFLQRFAARLEGLACGLALAVRPAGLAEVSRVNGAPQARPAQQSREVKGSQIINTLS